MFFFKKKDSDVSMKETETFSEEISAGDDETSDSDDNLVFAADDDDEYDFLSTDASNNRIGYNKPYVGEISSSDTDSEFEIQDDDTRNVRFTVKSRTAPTKTRILYIQMEYCEKQTLRDIIDLGINEEEGWRLLYNNISYIRIHIYIFVCI